MSKYQKQNKPTLALESIQRSESIKRHGIDVKEVTINHNKPEKTNAVFNDKYIEYKSKGNENTSVE